MTAVCRPLASSVRLGGLVTLALLLAPVQVRADDDQSPRLWEFEYSTAGRPTIIRDPIGHEQRFQYDHEGRLEEVDSTLGGKTKYAYGDGPDPIERQDQAGDWRFTYDPVGRLTDFRSPNDGAVHYEYDGASRVRRISVGDSWWMDYQYDLFDRLSKIRSPLGDVTYTRDATHTINGQTRPQVLRTLPNGVTTTWTYDSRDRLVALRHDFKDKLLSGWTYEHDELGRISKITDASEHVTYSYKYDTADRLIETRRDETVIERYSYDGSGKLNHIEWEDARHDIEYDRFGQAAKVDGRDRIYDRAGRLVRDSAGADMRTYDYDAAGRLASVRTSSHEIRYAYDDVGRLVRRDDAGESTFWLRDVRTRNAEVLAEYRDRQLDAVRLVADRPLATRFANGDVRFLLEDHLGNVRAITDQEGRLVGRRSFSSFGASPTLASSRVAPSFAGGIADRDTGLIHMQGRWYETQVGHFLTPTTRRGDLVDPARVDRYQFVSSDLNHNSAPKGLGLALPKWDGGWFDFQRYYRSIDSAEVGFFQRDFRNYGFIRLDTWLITSLMSFGRAAFDLTPASIAPAAQESYNSVREAIIDPSSSNILLALLRTGSAGLSVFGVTKAGKAFFKPLEALENRYLNAGAVKVLSGTGELERLSESGELATFNPKLLRKARIITDKTNGLGQYSFDKYIVDPLDLHRSQPQADYGNHSLLGRPPRNLPEESNLPIPRQRTPELQLPHTQSCSASSGLCAPPTAFNRGGNRPEPLGASLGGPGEDGRPPRSGAGIPRSDISVGGVYLDPQAQKLLHLGTLTGVSVDKAAGRLVLIGDEAPQATAHVDLDHLAVALAAAAQGVTWPGVTIDPPEGDLKADKGYYKYFGPATEHTRFGRALALADRWMKSISLGVDNEHPDQVVRPDVKSYKDLFQLGAEYAGDESNGWSRFWIVPQRIEWVASADGHSLWCKEARMMVKTQRMVVDNGKLVDAPELHRTSDEAFRAWFTDHYDDLARIYPVYAELRELAKLVSLAEYLREQLPPDEFARLTRTLVPGRVATPVSTPALRLTKSETKANEIVTMSIRGGVDLDPAKASSQAPGLVGDILADAVKRGVPQQPTPSATTLNIGGRTFQAVALPLSSLWRPGALTLTEHDIADGASSVFDRDYNSADTRDGPFGRGWRLRRPHIALPRPNSGAPPVVPAEVLGLVGLDQAPDFNLIEFQPDGALLHTTQGQVWRVGSDGAVLRIESEKGVLEYSEQDGKLVSAIYTDRNGKSWQTRLSYRGERIVNSVDDRIGRTEYTYGATGQLIEARSAGLLVRYDYDADERLRKRIENGVETRFAYGADGAVAATTDADGYPVSYRTEPDSAGGLRRAIAGGGEKAALRYDGHGDLVGVEAAGWAVADTHEKETVTRELRVGSRTEWREQTDLRASTLTRNIRNDRSVAIDLRSDGTPKSAVIRSLNSGEQADVHFDDAGDWLSITDSDGSTFQRIRDEDGVVTGISTPSGTYRFVADAAMRAIKLTGPEDFSVRVGVDHNGEVNEFIEGEGQAEVGWRRAEQQTWELRHASDLFRRITLDEEGRVTSAEIGDAVARAEYGAGGTRIVSAGGQQAVSRTDKDGRVTEYEEYPAGNSDQSLPLQDLIGAGHAEEPLVLLDRSEKKR